MIGTMAAPQYGAILEAEIRRTDRVPLLDARMGKIGLTGLFAGGVAGGADLLIRSQTNANSVAHDMFTPSALDLAYTGAAKVVHTAQTYQLQLIVFTTTS